MAFCYSLNVNFKKAELSLLSKVKKIQQSMLGAAIKGRKPWPYSSWLQDLSQGQQVLFFVLAGSSAISSIHLLFLCWDGIEEGVTSVLTWSQYVFNPPLLSL